MIKVLQGKWWILVVCLWAVVSLSGCTKLLPRSEEVTLSKWDSFRQIKTAYDQIEPGRNVEDLTKLGFDLEKTANMQRLNYTELVSLFQTSPQAGLAPQLQSCLEQPDECQAYVYELKRLRSKRVGNFWADFFNFYRKSDIRGWQFKMLLVLSRDKVVYKLWSGTPAIKKVHEERNPLGPLQSSGSRLLRVAYE
ncbi:hypothetical protein [Desulfuromonas acetoxidans]|uniref:hypothetical protein n=1 Tax=Desulfuromonas acetoxidans TaxID=891 RepID=UPI002931A86C|nr:hypothetical protein [Desulfuromonas acetoxidans]